MKMTASPRKSEEEYLPLFKTRAIMCLVPGATGKKKGTSQAGTNVLGTQWVIETLSATTIWVSGSGFRVHGLGHDNFG
jgi:hypothetical protein